MTALDQYALLEAAGRYRENPDAAPRDVFLTFGARALTIMGTDDMALAHWPLASLRAEENSTATGVILAPGPSSQESVELDDVTMMDAIAKVCPDLNRREAAARGQRRRSWLGWLLWLSVPVAILLLAAPWLKVAAVGLVPEARMRAFQDGVAAAMPALLAEGLPPVTCNGRDGMAALDILVRRIVGASPPAVMVWRNAGTEVLAIPGDRILLPASLIAEAETPEALAGIIAHAAGHLRAAGVDSGLAAGLGWREIGDLLLGDGPPEAIGAAASRLAARRHEAASETAADRIALKLLADAELPSLPYADLISDLGAGIRHPAGGRAEAAQAADTIGAAAFTPALSDRDWVALQGICG